MSIPTKLTLRLDASLIDRAKDYASDQDRSVSQLVADYFQRLTVRPRTAGKTAVAASHEEIVPPVGPITKSLRGALAPRSGDKKVKPAHSRADYHRYLEDKYL